MSMLKRLAAMIGMASVFVDSKPARVVHRNSNWLIATNDDSYPYPPDDIDPPVKTRPERRSNFSAGSKDVTALKPGVKEYYFNAEGLMNYSGPVVFKCKARDSENARRKFNNWRKSHA